VPVRSRQWPDPRVKPPYGAAEVDWGHPLARGLLAAWLLNEGGGGPRDLLGRGDGTPNNGAAYGVGPAGLGLNLVSASSHYVSCGTAVPAISGEGAIAARLSTTTLGDDYHMAISRAGGGAAQDWEVQLDLGSNKLALAYNGGNHVLGGTALAAGTVYDWAATISTAGTAENFLNGALDNVNGAVSVWPIGAGPIEIGRRSGSAYYWNGFIYHIYHWDRRLLDSEALWLHDEPYAFLRSITRRRYFVGVLGGISGAAAITAPVSALAGSGTVLEVFSGTGTVAPPASTLAASALEVFTGSATVAPPGSALAGSGTVTIPGITGSASIAPPVSIPAGAGLVVIAITGTGSVAPAVSALEAYGNNGAVTVGGGGGIGRHWFYQPLPRLKPQLLLPPPEPITGRGAIRAPVSQVQGTGRLAVLGRGVLVGQAPEIRSDGQVMFLGRGGVRRRVANTRGAGFVGFPDDDIFGLELDELDLELA
jgi:hypothetical protein